MSGTFRLALDGSSTASIPHNAPASRISSALEALPSVAAPVEVTEERALSALVTSGSKIKAWRVAFVSNVGDVPLLTVQVRGSAAVLELHLGDAISKSVGEL